jgi:hypothetical protein
MVHSRAVQLVVAAVGLAVAVCVLREMVNAQGISLDFERGIPDQLPKDPVRDGRDQFTAGPRYPFHFGKGFHECLEEYLVPRPYRILNRLKAIDGYAMQAQIDGWDSCQLQIEQLSNRIDSIRVLRALRWKYCTWWDLLELHADEVRLTCAAIFGSLAILLVVKLTNRLTDRTREPV